MKKIYIASPYTIGDQTENIKIQIDTAHKLIENGFNVFAPLAFGHLLELAKKINYNKWLEIDIEWLLACDAVLRLEGESKGADLEVEYAKNNNIPVYYSITELLKNE